MFSLSLCGLSPGSLGSSHRPKTCLLDKLASAKVVYRSGCLSPCGLEKTWGLQVVTEPSPPRQWGSPPVTPNLLLHNRNQMDWCLTVILLTVCFFLHWSMLPWVVSPPKSIYIIGGVSGVQISETLIWLDLVHLMVPDFHSCAPWVSTLWAWPGWRGKTVINHKCVSFYCAHKPAQFVVARSPVLEPVATGDMNFTTWVGNTCTANVTPLLLTPLW